MTDSTQSMSAMLIKAIEGQLAPDLLEPKLEAAAAKLVDSAI
jgi:hypothetical protein